MATHPILVIKGHSLESTDDEEHLFERSHYLTVEYNGGYRLKVKTDLKSSYSEADRELIMASLKDYPDLQPSEVDETYPDLSYVLIDRIRQTFNDLSGVILLWNPLNDTPIANLGDCNPFVRNVNDILENVRTALASLPKIHVVA